MKKNGLLISLAFSIALISCHRKGCIDTNATNFDEKAKKDDGSCIYEVEKPTETPTVLDCYEFSQSGTSYELVDLGFDVDYIIDCKANVYCDLKINPGVTIEFKTDAGISIQSSGSINAIATTEKPIVFTGVDKVKGAWAGIFINSDDVKNKIQKCTIDYAGGIEFNSNGDKGAVILYANSRADISDNVIKNSQNYGINASYTNGTFIFNNNKISQSLKPMFIQPEYAGYISGGEFTGNTTDVIYIKTYSTGSGIESPQTWTDLNVPYRIKSGGDIVSQTNWVIAPNVILEFEPSSGILVTDGNSLKAVGTPNESINFRGVTQSPGAWKNIKYRGTNVLNEIAFATIAHGGEDPTNTKGVINLWYDDKLHIHDVEFKDNSACGVYGVIFSSQSSNPNYSSSNLTFTNMSCTESFQ